MINSPLASAVAEGFEILIEEADTREIGKFLAFTTEKVIAPQWLKTVCNVETVTSPDENNQQATYDRLSKNGIRYQIKFRGGKDLGIEQTRRTSGKNKGKGAKNGQVRYDVNSFDIILFVIPTNLVDQSTWEYLAIPALELEDPNMPGYCVGRVPKSIREKYSNKSAQVIKKYESISNL